MPLPELLLQSQNASNIKYLTALLECHQVSCCRRHEFAVPTEQGTYLSCCTIIVTSWSSCMLPALFLVRQSLQKKKFKLYNLEQQQMENALTRSISRLTIYNVGTFTTSNRIQMKLTRDGMWSTSWADISFLLLRWRARPHKKSPTSSERRGEQFHFMFS